MPNALNIKFLRSSKINISIKAGNFPLMKHMIFDFE